MSIAFATTLYSICATFNIFLVVKSNAIASFIRGYLKLLRDGKLLDLYKIKPSD